MTALAAILAEVGQAIAEDHALVAKLRRRPCDSCGIDRCPARASCAPVARAIAREAGDDRADDVERRHDRRLDREFEGGTW